MSSVYSSFAITDFLHDSSLGPCFPAFPAVDVLRPPSISYPAPYLRIREPWVSSRPEAPRHKHLAWRLGGRRRTSFEPNQHLPLAFSVNADSLQDPYVVHLGYPQLLGLRPDGWRWPCALIAKTRAALRRRVTHGPRWRNGMTDGSSSSQSSPVRIICSPHSANTTLKSGFRSVFRSEEGIIGRIELNIPSMCMSPPFFGDDDDFLCGISMLVSEFEFSVVQDLPWSPYVYLCVSDKSHRETPLQLNHGHDHPGPRAPRARRHFNCGST
ncbi:hypothetical protein FB451DRAFT_676705 [Mycena latifolia]|nr:hypothetical protein FB451DRAFT_676705 [Mycena latifolia]